VTKKEVTYTAGSTFLEAVKFYLKKMNVQLGSVGVHSYEGMGDLKYAVSMGYQASGKPVWVTEFAWWKAPSDADEIKYLREAVEFLEGSSQVGGYAWFMNRADKNPKISLLGKSGKLTPLGEEYVKLPSHNSHVFYRIPQLIEAGQYVFKDNMNLDKTTDASGDYDMVSNGGASSVDYNIHVDTAGTYTVKIRVSGTPGKIEVVQNDQVLGTAEPTGAEWQTVETTVPLLAGSQAVRIRCNGQTLHYVEFAKNQE
jgi:hypothetical protein